MLPKQQELLDYVQELESLLQPFASGEKPIYASKKLRDWQERISLQELIVPVVGGFSAGKSTLINAFLGEEYLPVAITPETSLAAELHYVPSKSLERLELIYKDDRIQKFAKEQFAEVNKQAGTACLVKVYLNNEKLKAIDPLILVDMPGFESPLDAHNKAIFSYLEKGVHYVVLVSVEDGAISRSMARQIADIQNVDEGLSFRRNFSFFLSKANLRSASDVQKVRQYLDEQLELQLDLQKSFVPSFVPSFIPLGLGENVRAEFQKVIAAINPDSLFPAIYRPGLKEVYHEVISNINVLLAALKKSAKSNEASLKELAANRTKLEEKQVETIAAAESRYSSSSVADIVDYVGNQLSLALEELVSAAKQSGDSLSQCLNEITRSALLSKTGDALDKITESIVGDFAIELGSLNEQMSDTVVDKIGGVAKNYVQQLEDKVLNAIRQSPVTQKPQGKGPTGGSARPATFKTVTTILAVTTKFLVPILEVVIIFLPEIIGFFIKGSREAKQDEAIRQQILTVIIPDLKRNIRGELQVHFKQQVQKIIAQISQSFAEQLAQHEQSIAKAQEERAQHQEGLEQRLAEYKTLRQKIEVLAKPVLFS